MPSRFNYLIQNLYKQSTREHAPQYILPLLAYRGMILAVLRVTIPILRAIPIFQTLTIRLYICELWSGSVLGPHPGPWATVSLRHLGLFPNKNLNRSRSWHCVLKHFQTHPSNKASLAHFGIKDNGWTLIWVETWNRTKILYVPAKSGGKK